MCLGPGKEIINGTSGKCPRCKKRFVWTGNVRLRNARCPYCNTSLKRTTHLWRGDTIKIARPAVHYAPRGITQNIKRH